MSIYYFFHQLIGRKSRHQTTILTVKKAGHPNIKTKMFNFEASSMHSD